MFAIYLTNMGYFLQDEHATIWAALEKCKQVCFDAQIYQVLDAKTTKLVGYWTPFNGLELV